jgi:hypothetical protein
MVAAGMCLALHAAAASGKTVEQETLAHLANIRAIKAEGDKQTIEGYNRQMDAAWKYFKANKNAVLPVLRKELALELQKESPNNLILLDVGFFIHGQDAESDKALGKRALLKLDPASNIVRMNQQELFDFAYAAASSLDPQLLPFFDRAFLKSDVTAYVPQHALSLDETLVCVFLYGKYGKAGEAHLSAQLGDRTLARRIIEVLIWIGSPDSLQAVKGAMNASPDYDTFVRATAFMMMAGGPEGRATLLAVDPAKLEPKAREYYQKVRADVEKFSYQAAVQRIGSSTGSDTMPEELLKKRLSVMYDNFGKDDDISPSVIINSRLPRQFLAGELVRIRSRMFFRLSDEALDDVKVTNAILNALYYKHG